MTPDLQSLRIAAEKATKGPWSANIDECFSTRSLIGPDDQWLADFDTTINRDQSKTDTSYVALCSPETILALLARLEEAEKVIAPFAACCDQIDDDEDDEEWAKFRLIVANYRAARRFIAKEGGR